MTQRCPVAHTLDTTGRDIHAEAAGLRAQGPAVRVELPGGVHAWSVNDHATIRKILSDPRVTKSARNHWPDFIEGRIRPDWEMISWVAMDNMVTAYGKDHIRLRRLVGGAFSPRRTQAVKPLIEGLTNHLLDALESAEPGEVVDLRERFAYPLPAMLVAELIGMGEEQRVATAKVIDMMVDTTVTPEQAQAVLLNWRGAMEELVAQKRANPGEDITSDLIAARDEDGSRLSEAELCDTIFAILGAGSETTINFFDNAITALLSHPEQLRLVLSGEASWDDVIDETLRVESPLAHLPLRYAVEDIELDGVTIPKGDPILVNYSAVGRDPQLHGDSADAFDITRPDKDHLSFGHGPHYCLGAGIARLVAAVGLSSLFARFPELSLAVPAGELQPLPTFIMNGHRALPVRLTAPLPATAGAR
ncbi:cytochrome P450 [Streptomyces sp. NK15101]|uniref:cytochrome P450 family protein n=1 Tax=Streptomyces sp. NK15101 TaxID=2873261 RepID=UPI001CEC64BF|nr:cytochrome P450 [Streptomyces sp. NK15101]